jgi:hypothetical protein
MIPDLFRFPPFFSIEHIGPFRRRMNACTMTTITSTAYNRIPPPTFPVIIAKRTMMAVKTNSGGRGRGMQGWFRVHKQKPKVDSKDVLRGGNIKYDNKVNNIIKLQICHNEYDTFVIEPDETDRLFYTRAKFTVKDIQDKLNEVYDDYNEKNIIEYYDSDVSTWKPLIHINDVLKYRGGKIPFKIRLPQYYDETPLPPNYFYNVIGNDKEDVLHYTNNSDSYRISLIGLSVKAMIILMKHEGYERSDIKQYVLVHTNGDHEIPTRDYILKRANQDAELQSILLNHVNALQHMIEFIHYDFVWNKV